MQIEERKVTVGEVCDGYFNDAEEGVVGYSERLDIRPRYQREFVYKDRQRDEVIRTVMKGLPLNVIYWCKRGMTPTRSSMGNSALSRCASMSTDPSRLMTSTSTIYPMIRREKYLTTNCSFMSATAPTPRSWTGSASSTLPVSSCPIRS